MIESLKPNLKFYPDESMAHASRIEELLAEVEPEEGWDAPPGEDASLEP